MKTGFVIALPQELRTLTRQRATQIESFVKAEAAGLATVHWSCEALDTHEHFEVVKADRRTGDREAAGAAFSTATVVSDESAFGIARLNDFALDRLCKIAADDRQLADLLVRGCEFGARMRR